MNDIETANHILRYVEKLGMPFEWPTDGCGYEQHIKFVSHRNKYWRGHEYKQFVYFCRNYAYKLIEKGEVR